MTKTLKSLLLVAVLCSFRALSAYADISHQLISSGPTGSAGKPAAPADSVIFDNGLTGNTGLSSQRDNVYPFDSQVADNFTLAGALPYTVSGITFRGQYFNTPAGTAPATDNFNVFIYANNGGVPTGGPGDPSGTALFTRTLNGVPLGTATGGPLEFDWSLSWAGNPFVLAAGTQFWVAVQEIGSFAAQGQWGWSGNTRAGANGVQGFPLLGIPYWTPLSPARDVQFQLIGAQVPEPASGLLLITGLGLVGFVVRRRRSAT